MDGIEITATVEFSNSRPNFEGEIYLMQGWVYIPDKNEFIPRENIKKVTEEEDSK